MPSLTLGQASMFASLAGFQGQSLAIILAITQAEDTSLNTTATNVNSDGSVDRGILQINNRAHPEVSDACAFDPACAYTAGYRISKQGSDFHEWSTFTKATYMKYLGTKPTISVNTSVGKPWYSYPFGLTYGMGNAEGFEHGVDVSTPPDTPLTALLPGIVTDISAPSWGKQVTWKLDSPFNGIPYMYQIHMDAVNPVLTVGTHLNAGDLIGWSGGENDLSQIGSASNPTGTHYVDSPSMSSGPHTEVGFTEGPAYGSGAGYPTSENRDVAIIAFMRSVQSGAFPEPQGIGTPTGGISGMPGSFQQPVPPSIFSGAPVALTGLNDAFLKAGNITHQTLSNTPGFLGIAEALDEAEQFPGIYNAFSGDPNPLDWGSNAVMSVLGTITGNMMALTIRSLLILLGFIIIAGLVWRAAEPWMDVASQVAVEGAMAAA